MQIQFIPKIYNQLNNINFNKKSQISFGKSETDIFVKSSEIQKTPEELLKILYGDNTKLTKEFFDNLSEEEYKFCLNWAKEPEKKFSGMIQFSPNSVLQEDVDDLIKYVDFYYSGLQKIANKNGKKMEDVLVVGIGQSPVATIKLLELMGIKTANVPISGLTRFNEPVEKYINKKTVDNYLKYCKNFGFNIEDLFSDKLIVFTDHKETGRTFEVFKEIINKIIDLKKDEMEKQGKKRAKIKFLSLKEIFKNADKHSPEREWGVDFENSVFHSSYLKTLYSPLFKLPLSQINEIKKLHEQSLNSDRRIRFNRYTVLLYDGLYNSPKEINEQRKFSTVDADRKFRLAFYTPDEEPHIDSN